MIHLALLCIRDEMSAYLVAAGLPAAQLFNVAALENQPDAAGQPDGILLTLVNVEEESSLKNRSAVSRTMNGTASYEQPPIALNLYVLVTANFRSSYVQALENLSAAIQFFQHRKKFDLANSPHFNVTAAANLPDAARLLLYADLYTATFEQLNHLWGALGGRQIPFSLFKFRMVEIRDGRPFGQGPLIEEIVSDALPIVQKAF